MMGLCFFKKSKTQLQVVQTVNKVAGGQCFSGKKYEVNMQLGRPVTCVRCVQSQRGKGQEWGSWGHDG